MWGRTMQLYTERSAEYDGELEDALCRKTMRLYIERSAEYDGELEDALCRKTM